MSFTRKDVASAMKILAEHEAGSRYVPVDVRALLQKIATLEAVAS